MKPIAYPWSPYIIGNCQFPDESGPEYFVQDPQTGNILRYFFTYEAALAFAMEKSIVLKGKKIND